MFAEVLLRLLAAFRVPLCATWSGRYEKNNLQILASCGAYLFVCACSLMEWSCVVRSCFACSAFQLLRRCVLVVQRRSFHKLLDFIVCRSVCIASIWGKLYPSFLTLSVFPFLISSTHKLPMPCLPSSLPFPFLTLLVGWANLQITC
jgi:hypothetical protein